MNRSHRHRLGFSLLEVILAISVVLASLIVLGQLAYVGRRHATSAERAARGQVICRSLLAEMLAGAMPVEAVEWQAVANVPGWVYRVDIESAARFGLVAVSVTVAEEAKGGAEVATADEVAAIVPGEPPGAGRFRLTRWMPGNGAGVEPESSGFAPGPGEADPWGGAP